MSEVKEQSMEKVDNSKIFRKIVRDFNREKGFNFKLPEDTDYFSGYAHPVHAGDKIKISSQISPEHPAPYALRLETDSGSLDLGYDRDFTVEDIEKVVSSEAYKWRIEALKSLRNLQTELNNQIQEVKDNLLTDAVTEREKDEVYDTILTTAKRLYRKS